MIIITILGMLSKEQKKRLFRDYKIYSLHDLMEKITDDYNKFLKEIKLKEAICE